MRTVFLTLLLALPPLHAADSSVIALTVAEPKVSALLGVWQLDKESLAQVRQRTSEPQMIELILRESGTFLFQGVPAKWINESQKEMPVKVGSAGGTWKLRRNWDGWEILLKAPHASVAVHLRGEKSPYRISVQCADSIGPFEVTFRLSSLKD